MTALHDSGHMEITGQNRERITAKVLPKGWH
jgi:hypothetical protein